MTPREAGGEQDEDYSSKFKQTAVTVEEEVCLLTKRVPRDRRRRREEEGIDTKRRLNAEEKEGRVYIATAL